MKGKALISAGAVALALAGTASASVITECGRYAGRGWTHQGKWLPGVPGSPDGIMNLTTRRVGCHSALQFALDVTRLGANPFVPPHVQGFYCQVFGYVYVPRNENRDDIRCIKGPQVIHWQIGGWS